MRKHSKSDVQKIVAELKLQSDSLSSEIEGLHAKRKALNFFQSDQKQNIDKRIQELFDQRFFVNIASMMFMLYEDSLNPKATDGLSMEEMIKLEDEARQGDGISKLLVFTHSAFKEGDLSNIDMRRLEMEAYEGDRSSAAILACYKSYFE